MCLPRLRFTVRGMMLVVALAAAAMGAFMSWVRFGQLARDYRNGATYFALREAQNLEAVAQLQREIAAAEKRDDVVEAHRLRTYFLPEGRYWAAYHGRMKRHYERAASHPWERLPPELTRKPFPH